MTKVSLIANKAMTYATRRLQAGDEFLASERDATILTYAKKAKRKRAPGRVDAPPKSVVAKAKPVKPASGASELSGEPPTPDGTQVPVPEGWEGMHHTKIVALARELVGSDFEPREGQTKTEKARAIIAATEADRDNPPEKTGEA